MVSCKVSSTNPVNPNDIVSITIEEDPPVTLSVQDPAPARDSVDIDNSLTPFEKAAQSLYDELRKAYNLDPTGNLRCVAVVVSEDQGKTWHVKADSTETQTYKDQEQWSKVYVESEVAKTNEAYRKSNPSSKASPV